MEVETHSVRRLRPKDKEVQGKDIPLQSLFESTSKEYEAQDESTVSGNETEGSNTSE